MARLTMLSVLVGIALVGCATTRIVEPGRVEIGRAYTVDSPIRWSRFVENGVHIWTVDGPSLEAIYFISGIKEGKSPLALDQKERWPQFRPDMTPLELGEFVIDSLERLGFVQLQVDNLRSSPFGQREGLRFEFDFLYPNGLEGRGLGVGAILGDRLYLILYVGAREHYFLKHLDDVEKIIRSIELV